MEGQMTMRMVLLFLAPVIRPAGNNRWAEQCQVVQVAIQSAYGILHSEECVRSEAGEGTRVFIDPVVVQRDGKETALLPEGTVCRGQLVVVRRVRRAKNSDRWTGAVVVELTEKGHNRHEFYAHLDVLEPQTGLAAGVGCGAEGEACSSNAATSGQLRRELNGRI